ncbi:MAG: DUF262 domain-containing protein [Bacteroidota bacterium]|nr:DUF262 domain-containing protein [Bacteroidota bacterium]
MEDQNFIAEETSFWELLQKTKIEIPIIQRDYAQGRTSEVKVRQNFLGALHDAITAGTTLELDFIYGSKESGSMQPLDGQQRLTTLFLLHWYAACKENIILDFTEAFERFTYETRYSSRDFCEQLAKHGLNFDQLIPADQDLQNRVSKTIIDAPWFFLAWWKDPTILAMLNMLDDIDALFCDVSSLWSKLSGNRLISFHYIELKNFGLSDDLYIKMNARGKALTPFENFKARLERHINRDGWDEKAASKFAHDVDTTWTDLFWGRVNDPKQIDAAFIKYFAGIAINLYALREEFIPEDSDRERMRSALQKRSTNKVTEEAIKRALIEERIETLFNKPDELSQADFQSPEDLGYLSEGLNIYAKIYRNVAGLDIQGLSLWDFSANSDLLHEFSRPKGLTTYKQRVLFYAQTAFLLTGLTMGEALANWMRVIRNIVEHATIDRAAGFIGAIGLVNELSAGCPDIYAYLASNKVKSDFADNQVKEELRKAKLINQFGLSNKVFHAMEDTNFCRGRIMFGLYCMDLHQSDASGVDVEVVNAYTKAFNTYLANEVSNVFRRALLTIGDNRFYVYWWSWSYNTETNKRCLIENMGDLKAFAYNDGMRHYLRSLMKELVKKTPQNVVDDFTPVETTMSWVTKIIKDEKLLDNHGQSKYMGLTADEKACYLYNGWKRPGSLNDCYKVK